MIRGRIDLFNVPTVDVGHFGARVSDSREHDVGDLIENSGSVDRNQRYRCISVICSFICCVDRSMCRSST